MFGKKSTGGYEFLIVGLGNYGKKYEFTRHNAGFMCLDYYAAENCLRINKLKFKSLVGDAVINGKKCLLMEPQTYMNNSGEAVIEAVNFYKIPPENVIVIFDDISLDVGNIRIRRKGSAGGHNGIKNIIAHLGTENFPRVKVGVGQKPHPDYDLVNWVLSSFSKSDLEKMHDAAVKVVDILSLMVDGNVEEAMNRYNS